MASFVGPQRERQRLHADLALHQFLWLPLLSKYVSDATS